MKIDRTDPKCSYNKTVTKTQDGVDGTIGCSDSHSGCSSDNPTSFKNLKADKSYTVKDNVGNSDTCTVDVKSYTLYKCHGKKDSCSCKSGWKHIYTNMCSLSVSKTNKADCEATSCHSTYHGDCQYLPVTGYYACNVTRTWDCVKVCDNSSTKTWRSSSNGCSCEEGTFYK